MSDELKFLSMPNAPVETADILILPVPFERDGAFKPGTDRAPAAILAAADRLEFFEEDAGWSPFKHMTCRVLPAATDDRAVPPGNWHDALASHIRRMPTQNLLVTLGGDHSLTPTVTAARMPEPGTVLYLDAHGDLRASYRGNPYNHACSAFRLLEQGHQLVMAGTRSVCEAEVELIARDRRVTLFMDWDLRGQGQWDSFLEKIRSLKGPLYLSIDLDVFSPSLVPGVTHPQPGGFSWYQMIETLEALFSRPKLDLRGVDLVEMVPEPSRVSEMVGAKLLLKIISFWGKAHRMDRRPLTGSQLQVAYE